MIVNILLVFIALSNIITSSPFAITNNYISNRLQMTKLNSYYRNDNIINIDKINNNSGIFNNSNNKKIYK
jgi:hypothetical protein